MKWLTKSRKPKTDRDIFEFFDGEKDRQIDPLEVWYALWANEDIDSLLPRAANNEMEAVEELMELTRKTFSIKKYDPATGTGLTVSEVQKLLAKYFTYCNLLKKKLGPLPIPFRKSVPLRSPNPSTTPPDADSPSSPSESPIDEPSTTSTPSPQPSTTP